MTDDFIQELADNLRYKDWTLIFTTQHADLRGQVIYWMWRAPCVNTGMPAWQTSPAFALRSTITEDGFVRLAYLLAQEAEMHECAEHFHYKRRRVFDPHASVV